MDLQYTIRNIIVQSISVYESEFWKNSRTPDVKGIADHIQSLERKDGNRSSAKHISMYQQSTLELLSMDP